MRLNLVIVTRRYPPFTGGAENQLARVASGLSKRGADVTVLTGWQGRSSRCNTGEAGSQKICRVPDPRVRWFGTALFLAGLIVRMLLGYRNYDIVLTSGINETSCIAIVIARLLRKKVLVRLTNYGPEYGNVAWARERTLGTFYLLAVRKADALIVQHDGFLRDIRESNLPLDRTVVIPNAAPVAGANRDENPRLVDSTRDGPFIILWCGRLVKMKGVGLICDIAEILRQRQEDFRIHVLGTGPLQGELYEHIKHSGLENHVLYRGFCENVQAEMECSHALLLTSIFDPMPNVVLEAMSYGLPVVASRVGGVPKLIDDEQTGLLFEVGDAKHAAGALSRLMSEPEITKAIALKARKVVARYSSDSIAERYEGLCEAVLD